ncbi:MAG: type IV pilus biogenesis/stability protein PilW [Gammaproteobacteria bacterium]
MIPRLKVMILILFCAVLSACNTLQQDPQPVKSKNTQAALVNIQLGMTYLKRGKIRIAQNKLQTAIEEDPKLPEAWYSMGYFLEKTGHKQVAKQYYLNSIALGSHRGDVQNNYGTFLCRSGNYQEAVDHFIMATKDSQYNDAAGAYENAGLCALKIPDKKQAGEYFHLALQKDPGRAISRVQLARLKKDSVME